METIDVFSDQSIALKTSDNSNRRDFRHPGSGGRQIRTLGKGRRGSKMGKNFRKSFTDAP